MARFSKGGKIINEAAGAIGKVAKKGVHPSVKKTAGKLVRKAVRYIGKNALSEQIESVAYGVMSTLSSKYFKLARECTK